MLPRGLGRLGRGSEPLSRGSVERPAIRTGSGTLRPMFRSCMGSEARCLLVAVLSTLAVMLPQPASAAAAIAGRVVLISLDGLYPDVYRRASELDLEVPNLERLANAGTSADGMLGIFPTSTYPSHTTLITGVTPARHGVVANSVFSPGSSDGGWYWFADSLQARTLPQAAADAKLDVAVSNWPALVGAPWVRWHLPEIWSLGESDATSREKTLRWATPGLVAEVENKTGRPWTDARFEWGAQDDRITDGAVTLLESKKPHLLLVHLVEVDHVLHAEGRDAPKALRAFEVADAQIGRILTALDRAGLADSTNVVIVGDHGFANVHTDVRPNVVLVRLGLQAADGARATTWRAWARTTTAAAAVYVRDPADRDAATKARAEFNAMARGPYAGVFDVLDRAALDRYGAFPGAAFGLACHLGYSFSGSASGDVLVRSRSRGMHGYRPEETAMYAGFVAR